MGKKKKNKEVKDELDNSKNEDVKKEEKVEKEVTKNEESSKKEDKKEEKIDKEKEVKEEKKQEESKVKNGEVKEEPIVNVSTTNNVISNDASSNVTNGLSGRTFTVSANDISGQMISVKTKQSKAPLIIAIIFIVILGLSALGFGGVILFKYFNTSDSKEVEEEIDTGSDWGDSFGKYLKDNIFKNTSKANVVVIDVNGDNEPEMIITFEDKEDDEKATYTSVLYMDSDEVKETNRLQDVSATILYSVDTGDKGWYLEQKDSKGKVSSYASILKMMKGTEKSSKTDCSDEATDCISSDEAITVDDIGVDYVKADVTLKTKKVTADDLNDDMSEVVSKYDDTKVYVTESQEKTIKEKITELKKDKAIKEAKITQSNYSEKILNNLKWFVGAYYGPDYGWYKVFTFKEVTGTVTIPNVTETDDTMIYEVVGLTSLESLKEQLRKYVSESIWSRFSTTVGDGFTEYNGKVYRIRGGIGDSDYFDFDKTQVLSSDDNGVTKVKIFAYNPIMDSEDPVEEVTLTITYDTDKKTYLITDWSSNK